MPRPEEIHKTFRFHIPRTLYRNLKLFFAAIQLDVIMLWFQIAGMDIQIGKLSP